LVSALAWQDKRKKLNIQKYNDDLAVWHQRQVSGFRHLDMHTALSQRMPGAAIQESPAMWVCVIDW